MKETLLFLATPIAASILLAGVLGYFGTHILTRGIIFIDIAIAQIAALGTMIGLLLGFAEESAGVQLLSYLFTLIVIGSFAFLRTKQSIIPAEAVIGIIYCLGLAFALLLAEKIPGGSNFISKTITGNILWVTWDKVLILALIFAGIGLIHLVFGAKFINLSEICRIDPSLKLRDKLYNLLFYTTFCIVVVKSVQIGGIFLVFTYPPISDKYLQRATLKQGADRDHRNRGRDPVILFPEYFQWTGHSGTTRIAGIHPGLY